MQNAIFNMQLFRLDSSSQTPLFRQLYIEMRNAILERRLAAGTKLPSTRELSGDLNVSRNTVLNAYEQLLAEGYIRGKIGSGSYVSDLKHEPSKQNLSPRKNVLSKRGKLLFQTMVSNPSLPNAKISFRPGTPALEKFPFVYWGKLLKHSLQMLRARDFHYSDPAGYPPLRKAIAAYLNRNRGLQCNPSQVIILNGSQQALDLSCKVLLNETDTVWMEDPGYKGARAAFHTHGAKIVSVPIDSEGLQWHNLSIHGRPKLIYVTPSHQFPLGITMSLQRRLGLIELAAKNKSWILEDDYDSEFRYDGRPIAALQGLDQNHRVLYIGTFSKVMFAGLRLGYIVVPEDLVPAFVRAKAVTDRHAAILEQAALAEFLISGRFERHIREMRKLYHQRQQKLVEAIGRLLPGVVSAKPHPSGMHLIGWLNRTMDDKVVSNRLAQSGIEAPALSLYMERKRRPGGLLLGYSGLSSQQLTFAVTMIQNILNHVPGASSEGAD